MEYRPLGRTGVEISRIVLGCGNFGGIGSAPEFFGGGEDELAAFRIMDAAWELGVTAFDTADAYGGGRSETAIGRWLATRDGSVRERVVLATKVFNPMGAGEDGGLSRERVRRQLESSLSRLGVERVPLYLTHEPDPETPIEETLETLDELVADGRIGAIGASNVSGGELEQALAASEARGLVRYDWVQNSYSLLDRDAEDDVLPVCRERGLGFTAFSPLAGGWLTGKYRAHEAPQAGSRMELRPGPYEHLRTESVFHGLEALSGAASERGVSPAGLALAWLLAQPDVTAVIVGPRRPDHLEPAREALELELSAAEREELAAVFDP